MKSKWVIGLGWHAMFILSLGLEELLNKTKEKKYSARVYKEGQYESEDNFCVMNVDMNLQMDGKCPACNSWNTFLRKNFCQK
ncbi:MAG: hypothetical protein ACLS9A_07555 [Clostridia bacterium]